MPRPRRIARAAGLGLDARRRAAAAAPSLAPFAAGRDNASPRSALALALLGAGGAATGSKTLDSSVLRRARRRGGARPGRGDRARAVGPVRAAGAGSGPGFDRRAVDEPARLELPLGRAPPQGAILELVATVEAPRGPDEPGGFDEATYLRRQGVHAILRAGAYREVGRRGGVLGVVDRLRARLAASIAPGPRRRAAAR